MVGREVESHVQSRGMNQCEVVLQVLGLTRPNRFENVSFGVRAGEIVSLYGLLGAGQMDMMRALFGSPAATSGEIAMNGAHVKIGSVPDAIGAGIGLVSEDRKREGLVLGLSVSDNLTLG